MKNQLETFGIHNYEFIEEFDRDTLTREQLSRFSRIKPSEVSLFLKHIQSLHNFIVSGKQFCVVTEDDSVFDANMFDKLRQVQHELSDNTNYVIFCSDSCNIHTSEKVTSGRLVYSARGSRGTGFYIISHLAAEIALNKYNGQKISNVPIDHWFNSLTSDIRFYYSEPYIARQGPEMGKFKSSISR